MDALVADVAIAVGPVPVPVVVEAVPGEGALRRRTEPQIVVHAGGRGSVGLAADGVAPFEAERARHVDVADGARFQFLCGVAKRQGGAAVDSVLHDAIVLARRGHQLAGFEDVMGAGFFAIDILARLAGPDSDQRVPVVGRGDGDGVDGFVFEQLADVGEAGGALLAGAFDFLEAHVEDGLIDIAHGGDFDVGHG